MKPVIISCLVHTLTLLPQVPLSSVWRLSHTWSSIGRLRHWLWTVHAVAQICPLALHHTAPSADHSHAWMIAGHEPRHYLTEKSRCQRQIKSRNWFHIKAGTCWAVRKIVSLTLVSSSSCFLSSSMFWLREFLLRCSWDTRASCSSSFLPSSAVLWKNYVNIWILDVSNQCINVSVVLVKYEFV